VVPPDLDVGVLKIADLGLAKHHNVGTEFRLAQTSMKYTTEKYEPPEAGPGISTTLGRSRRQDIWSIGCVTLEFVIWLLYGASGLTEFSKKLVGDMKPIRYYEIEEKGGQKTAKVHTAVNDTMDALLRDQECRAEDGTAIRDLINIIKKKLLVVKLGPATTSDNTAPSSPPSLSTTLTGFRASAREFVVELDTIFAKGERNERYWYTGKPRGHLVQLPKTPSQAPESLLSPDSAHRKGIPTRQKEPPIPTTSEDLTFAVPLVTQSVKDEYRNAAQIDKTNFPVDNKFAAEIVNAIGVGLFPKYTAPIRRCDDCQKLDFFEPQFHVVDTWEALEKKLKICDFCQMRLEIAQKFLTRNVSTIRFDRDQSMLKLNEGQIPVMSICRSPGEFFYKVKAGPLSISRVGVSYVSQKCRLGTHISSR
jgi:serine/threonine protein kinase